MKQESIRIANYNVTTYTKEGVTFIKFIRDDGFGATFTDLGASIYEIYFDNKLMNLVPSKISDFKKNNIYHGKTIGRIANRIKDAKIIVDSIEYKLDPNDNGNTLHGGRGGLSSKYFDFEIGANKTAVGIEFTYKSPHLEAGFPETVDFIIRYFLYSDLKHFSISYAHNATSDRDTPIRLTNHTYFTLGESTIDNLTLDANVNAMIKTDENNLPLEIIKHRSRFIYHGEKGTESFYKDYLKKNRRMDIDNYFFLSKHKDQNGFFRQVILRSQKYLLSIDTSYPGAQIYTDHIEDGISYKNTIEKSRRGIAIEPSLPTNENCILKANSNYFNGVLLEFYRIKKNK